MRFCDFGPDTLGDHETQSLSILLGVGTDEVLQQAAWINLEDDLKFSCYYSEETVSLNHVICSRSFEDPLNRNLMHISDTTCEVLTYQPAAV